MKKVLKIALALIYSIGLCAFGGWCAIEMDTDDANAWWMVLGAFCFLGAPAVDSYRRLFKWLFDLEEL